MTAILVMIKLNYQEQITFGAPLFVCVCVFVSIVVPHNPLPSWLKGNNLPLCHISLVCASDTNLVFISFQFFLAVVFLLRRYLVAHVISAQANDVK